MDNQHVLYVNELGNDEKCVITSIEGGYGFVVKMDALGLRIGTEFHVVSRQWMKGPITVRVNDTEVAIGYGMAGKIGVKRL